MPVRLAHWEMLCMSLPRLSVRNALEKEKHGYPEEWVHRLQKVKYVLLAFLLLSCITGFYSKLQEWVHGMYFPCLQQADCRNLPTLWEQFCRSWLWSECVHRSVSSASFSVLWEQYLQSCRSSREHFSNVIVQTVRQSALSVRRDVLHIWILTAILHIQGNASAVTPALQSAQGKYSYRHCYW